MSWPGSRISRALRRVFPFTLWGGLYLLLSGAVLAVALVRMELAALLWGSSFLLLGLYCLAGNHLARLGLLRHLRRTPDPLDCSLPGEGFFPGESVAAELRADMPPRLLPGFQLSVCLELAWEGRPALQLRSPLSAGRNHRTVLLSLPHRGCYRSEEGRLQLRDRLGFCASELPVALRETVVVYPALAAGASPQLPLFSGGGERERRRRRLRSEELLEVRKYFPGDDIRRIHWKVYAHLDELFLRIGEETPPPRSRLLVLLDAAPSAAVPPVVAADYLDGLVGACGAAVQALLSRGLQVLFAALHEGAPLTVTPEKMRALLARLAGVWWTGTYGLQLPPEPGLPVLLFSSPGSPNLQRIMRELERRDCSVRLTLKELPPFGEGLGRRSLRELFLRPPPTPEPRAGAGPSPSALEAFGDALALETGRWRGRQTVVGRV
jgi:uncharacterized protein (DUF58 family)